MTAGIVTFFDHNNYGAVLQSYALQKILEINGAAVYHLRFPSTKVEENAPTPCHPLIKKIGEHGRIRDQRFASFRDKYLNVKEYCPETLSGTDVFITGSDQVFNPTIPGWDSRYLLQFAGNAPKVSYAASFGESPDEKFSGLFKAGLEDFSSISVREKSGVQIVKALTGKDANCVLDPVFLIPSEEWERIASESSLELSASKPYILLIAVQNDLSVYNEWKSLAEKRGLELRIISPSLFLPAGFESWSGVGVEDFLKLLQNAEEVATSSFHALAFSIIFRKKFHILSPQTDLQARSGRLAELLDLLDADGTSLTEKSYDILAEEAIKSTGFIKSHILEI